MPHCSARADPFLKSAIETVGLQTLWMRSNRDDGQNRHPLGTFFLVRTIMEKHSIGSRGFVLRVGFPDPFAIGSLQGGKLMRMKAGMRRVDLQQTESLLHLLEKPLFGRVFLQGGKLRFGFVGEAK
jgi:hypothetical protein